MQRERKLALMKQALAKKKGGMKKKVAMKKGDIGKKNVPGKTGFKSVANKAAAEYGSEEAGNKVAGAVLKKMKAKGQV